MLLLTLLEAAAEALPHATTEPANVYTAWVAWAAAIGAVAVALGPVLKAKAAERVEPAQPAAAAPPAEVDEKKLADFVLSVFRAHYGDEVRRLWKHHLELHSAMFGDKLLGADGIVEQVRDNAESQARIEALLTELVDDLHAKRRDNERALLEAAAVIKSGGTNPGTGRR